MLYNGHFKDIHMHQQIDLMQYQNFVQAVTSAPSNDITAFIDRVNELNHIHLGEGSDINVSLLLTAALGLGSETGEFQEIVKKMFFQGKPLTADNVFHLKRELGDVMFYWITACRALNLDPHDVITENVNKLQARYPGGAFDVYHSENRKAGDI
jgi:NTP pyrophosphatase (non-canonical NTP hydrolase)